MTTDTIERAKSAPPNHEKNDEEVTQIRRMSTTLARDHLFLLNNL